MPRAPRLAVRRAIGDGSRRRIRRQAQLSEGDSVDGPQSRDESFGQGEDAASGSQHVVAVRVSPGHLTGWFAVPQTDALWALELF